MAHWPRAGLALAFALAALTPTSSSFAQSNTASVPDPGADAATEQSFGLNRGGNALSRRYVGSQENWLYVSRPLANKGGMFPDFEMFIAMTSNGTFEGMIFVNSMSALVGEGSAKNDFEDLNAFTLVVEGGESVLVPLSNMKSAQVEARGETQSGGDVYFKTFTLPQKAYRMMGVLPDENRMRFLFRKQDGNIGAMSYHYSYKETMPWAMSIGYAKKLSKLARDNAQ